jgi:hypothetical protein
MNTKLANEFKAPSHTVESVTTVEVISASPLLGTWVKIDKATRDIVKIIITGAGSGISVEVFGACSPTPCDWGSVSGIAYAANVSSSRAIAFSAPYQFGFARAIVVGRLHERQLVIETFTEFTDGSGRSNLYTTDHMVR